MKTLTIWKGLLLHLKKLKKAEETILRIEKELPPDRQNDERRQENEFELIRTNYKIRKAKKRIEDFAY